MIIEDKEKTAEYLMLGLNDCTYDMALSILTRLRKSGIDVYTAWSRIEALSMMEGRSVKVIAKQVFDEMFLNYDIKIRNGYIK